MSDTESTRSRSRREAAVHAASALSATSPARGARHRSRSRSRSPSSAVASRASSPAATAPTRRQLRTRNAAGRAAAAARHLSGGDSSGESSDDGGDSDDDDGGADDDDVEEADGAGAAASDDDDAAAPVPAPLASTAAGFRRPEVQFALRDEEQQFYRLKDELQARREREVAAEIRAAQEWRHEALIKEIATLEAIANERRDNSRQQHAVIDELLRKAFESDRKVALDEARSERNAARSRAMNTIRSQLRALEEERVAMSLHGGTATTTTSAAAAAAAASAAAATAAAAATSTTTTAAASTSAASASIDASGTAGLAVAAPAPFVAGDASAFPRRAKLRAVQREARRLLPEPSSAALAEATAAAQSAATAAAIAAAKRRPSQLAIPFQLREQELNEDVLQFQQVLNVTNKRSTTLRQAQQAQHAGTSLP